MRLIDMEPTWFGDRQGHGQGVHFNCPVHGSEHKIGVPFENPIDGGPKTVQGLGKNRDTWWHREGETFETLTITPSIHCKDVGPSGDPDAADATTHWHGFVTNGQVA